MKNGRKKKKRERKRKLERGRKENWNMIKGEGEKT